MISNRHWISLCLAGLCWSAVAVAQEGAASGSGGAAGAESSEAAPAGKAPAGKTSEEAPAEGEPADPATPGGTPAPKPGGTVDPFIPTTPKPDDAAPGPGASSAFGTPGGAGETPAEEGTPEEGAAGSSSAFGPGDATATQQAPPSFTLPGFFGGAPTTYTGGQGRLARPRFRYKVTVSQGYDDNVFQTPDKPIQFPDQIILIDPGTPDTFVPVTRVIGTQPGFEGGILVDVPVTQTTVERIRGQPPVFQTIRAPKPQERQGSLVSRLGLRLDAQQVTRRSLFTLDLNGSVDHYWNRPGQDGKNDLSGALSMAYAYNFTPRLTASLSTNVAYLSQPDLTRINTPDRPGAGDLVNALARLNLTFRATPRLTGTLSVGQNAVIFVDEDAQGAAGISNNGDTYETTFSAEAKYLWKPRYSLLAEFRHVLINYPDQTSLNARTEVLLLGAELRLSARLSATVRLGHAIRIFEETGESSGAPYAEGVVNYRLGPTSSVQWSSRFGFEEPPTANTEVLAYRTSLNYFKAFTPRLSLSIAIAGVSRHATSDVGAADQSDQTLSISTGLEYRFNRQLTLNATYSFTKLLSSDGFQDYDRSRIFLGADYEF